MSYKKVIELANKLIKKADNLDKSKQFDEQIVKFEAFSNDFARKFTAVLTEMEGDLGNLKIKKFYPDHWSMFAKIYLKLTLIRKEVAVTDPYIAANKLVNFINNKSMFKYLTELDDIIQKFLKKTEVDTALINGEPHVLARSIKLIKALTHYVAKYMADNPEITINNRRLSNEFEGAPANPDDATKPGIPGKI